MFAQGRILPRNRVAPHGAGRDAAHEADIHILAAARLVAMHGENVGTRLQNSGGQLAQPFVAGVVAFQARDQLAVEVDFSVLVVETIKLCADRRFAIRYEGAAQVNVGRTPGSANGYARRAR